MVFLASFFIVFCTGGVSAFSVFSQALQQSSGGTASQVALAYSINLFFLAFIGIFAGRIVDKSSPKILMYLGGLLLGLGWALSAVVTSPVMLCLTFGVMAGTGAGLVYNPCITLALRWYPEKRGTMSGILLASASLGPITTAKAGVWLYSVIGIYGLAVIGAAFLILTWGFGWLVKPPIEGWQPPEPKKKNSAVVPSGASALSPARDFTPLEMVKSKEFWVMAVLYMLASTAGILLLGTLSTIGQVQLGITAQTAANLVVINCVANFAGRTFVGKLCDALGETKTLLILLVATCVALFGMRSSYSLGAFVAFLILNGFSFGGILVVFPPLTSRLFGLKNAGINYGIMFMAYAVAALFAPQIGALAAKPELGAATYSFSFLLAICIAVAGIAVDIVLMFVMKKRNVKA